MRARKRRTRQRLPSTCFAAVFLALALALVAPPADARCRVEHPLTAIGPRLARLGQPAPLIMLAGAIAAPLVLAPTGIDQDVRVFSQRDLGGRYNVERISVAAPYALAGALSVGYLTALATDDCPSAALMARPLQAMGIAFGIMSAAKFLVGRSWPAGDPYAEDRLVDDGRSTRLEPFTVGAWPSGHAATLFAFAAALRTAAPAELGILRYAGYALAGAVSAMMLYGDHHWASDLVSGALLGESVGRSVGAPAPTTRGVDVVPAGPGLAVTATF